jgi:hypothetical protein
MVDGYAIGKILWVVITSNLLNVKLCENRIIAIVFIYFGIGK